MAAAALRFTCVKFHIVWTLQMLEQTSQTRCSRVSTMANYITRRIWMSCCSVHGPQVLSDRNLLLRRPVALLLHTPGRSHVSTTRFGCEEGAQITSLHVQACSGSSSQRPT